MTTLPGVLSAGVACLAHKRFPRYKHCGNTGCMAYIDLYDHEILEAEKVLAALNEKRAKVVNLEAFRQEIIGRFEEIGLEVVAKVWGTNEEGLYAFDIEIQGRCEPHAFDYDRQVHEVTSDILDLLPNQDKGIIKSEKLGEQAKHTH